MHRISRSKHLQPLVFLPQPHQISARFAKLSVATPRTKRMGGGAGRFAACAMAVCLTATLFPPAAALAAESPEVRCRTAIAKSARAFALKLHTVRAKCENRMVDLNSCNETKDADKVSKAADKVAGAVAKRCTVDLLAALGFPGSCDDADGPPFTAEDAAACLVASHTAITEQLIAIEYPGPPAPVNRETSHCADHIGRSRQYAARQLKTRQRCVIEQERGRISPGVLCQENSEPAQTGDAKTDASLAKTAVQSARNLVDGCDHTTLEDLGFPGSCVDETGAPFTLDDLVACVETTHATLALDFLQAEFP